MGFFSIQNIVQSVREAKIRAKQPMDPFRRKLASTLRNCALLLRSRKGNWQLLAVKRTSAGRVSGLSACGTDWNPDECALQEQGRILGGCRGRENADGDTPAGI